MKIAINIAFGGFWLSDEALSLLGYSQDYIKNYQIKRDDPKLIEVIEKLGDKSSHCPGEIKIVEIPDDVTDWYIHEYDGIEWICEGRTWEYEENDGKKVTM